MMQQKPMAGRLWFVVSIGLAMIAPSLQLTADEPTAEQLEFFEAKVRPILVEHCNECHSAEEGTTEAGLSLDSRAGWQTGGDSGTAIVPGKPDQSLLIEAIGYEEDVVSGMPPRSKL